MSQILNPLELQEICKNKDIAEFSRKVLGITLHSGQKKWANGAWKMINILDPGNQWGKTMCEAIIHIYHACTKPMLFGRVTSPSAWQQITYRTLNVGKTYEIARGVFESIVDIVEGEVLLPDGTTNNSMLKGWVIAKKVDTANKPPMIYWWNNSETLIRSYDDLGSSFKRLKLAFVSSDECGDIPELELFLNGTLLPRIAFWCGLIHLVGTHQPKGEDYKHISDLAIADMERFGEQSDYFHMTGNLYENDYMSKDFIRRIENIADPRIREQIIYGQYVDGRDHFFNFDECDHMFTDLPYDFETGYSEKIDPTGFYVFSVDLAATEDETAATCIRYNIFEHNRFTNQSIEQPYRIVFHKGFKGETIPISMQYELIRSWFMEIKTIAKNTAFVFDAGSLGGKNAEDAFKDLYGYGFPGLHKSYAQEKAYAIGAVKDVLGRGRKVVKNGESSYTDIIKEWGWLKASRHLKELRRQFESYALDDKGLKQDRIATVWQAIHFIEKRRPKQSHNKAVDLDMLSTTIQNYGRH